MIATRLLLVVAVLGVTGCSDTPLEAPDTPDLSGLIVSEAHPVALAEGPVGAASTGLVAYVSLPPGMLSDVVSVRIRNLTTGGTSGQDVTVVNGGFDPVVIPSAPGDRLELRLTQRNSAVTFVEASDR
jgi:hypothetical protein